MNGSTRKTLADCYCENDHQTIVIERATPDDAQCWIWNLYLSVDGYGRIRHRGKTWEAHRFSYEAFESSIPAGLTLDHLCRVRACVNPAHLEPVTNRVNIGRGYATRWREGAFKGARRGRNTVGPKRPYRASSDFGPGDPRHGTINGYVNYGCRCDECREARRLYARSQRAGTA